MTQRCVLLCHRINDAWRNVMSIVGLMTQCRVCRKIDDSWHNVLFIVRNVILMWYLKPSILSLDCIRLNFGVTSCIVIHCASSCIVTWQSLVCVAAGRGRCDLWSSWGVSLQVNYSRLTLQAHDYRWSLQAHDCCMSLQAHDYRVSLQAMTIACRCRFMTIPHTCLLNELKFWYQHLLCE